MANLDRRDCLRHGVFGIAAAFAALHSSTAADEPAVQGIDAHTHFYDPTRAGGIPWPSKDDKVLYRRVLPEHFVAVAKPCGVTSTVVVEASPRLEDNQWLLDLAGRSPAIAGVIGHLKPGDDSFADHLKRFAKDPLFRGSRVNAGELGKGLEQAGYLDDLKRMVDSDLTLDVNGGPDMPPGVAKLAERLPKLRIVINHAANSVIDGKPVKQDWLAGMRTAAKHANVFCKVSALVDGTRKSDGTAPAQLDFYRPVLDAVWDTFGVDRLIYGSNWPVSERYATYATLHGVVSAYCREKGKAAGEKFFRRNAVAAYKLPERK
jgi:predicted TIM-barrel fold metal-dependent hydrolase